MPVKIWNRMILLEIELRSMCKQLNYMKLLNLNQTHNQILDV